MVDAVHAVTVKYRDGTEIQLLPAVRVDGELAVSSGDSDSWVQIRPREFARVRTATNQSQGRAVVPAIKLVKAIFANRFGDNGPSGPLQRVEESSAPPEVRRFFV